LALSGLLFLAGQCELKNQTEFYFEKYLREREGEEREREGRERGGERGRERGRGEREGGREVDNNNLCLDVML
jgi:hypothetical protein